MEQQCVSDCIRPGQGIHFRSVEAREVEEVRVMKEVKEVRTVQVVQLGHVHFQYQT